MDAYYDDMARDAEYEAAREEWEAEQRESMYEEQEALEEALRDANRENCYADYSSGKKPEMNCEYSVGTSSSISSSQDDTIVGAFIVIIIVATIVFFIYKMLNRNK